MTAQTDGGGGGRMADMPMERLRAILDAYGAAPVRWPAAERSRARALLDGSEDARLAHAEAMRLDVALNHLNPPPPPSALAERLYRHGAVRRGMAAMLGRARPGRQGTGPGSGVLLRPAAFALTMLMGVVIGLAIPRGADPGADAGSDRVGTSVVALLPGDPVDAALSEDGAGGIGGEIQPFDSLAFDGSAAGEEDFADSADDDLTGARRSEDEHAVAPIAGYDPV